MALVQTTTSNLLFGTLSFNSKIRSLLIYFVSTGWSSKYFDRITTFLENSHGFVKLFLFLRDALRPTSKLSGFFQTSKIQIGYEVVSWPTIANLMYTIVELRLRFASLITLHRFSVAPRVWACPFQGFHLLL